MNAIVLRIPSVKASGKVEQWCYITKLGAKYYGIMMSNNIQFI